MNLNKRTIWTLTALVGGYVFCQILADVAATKLIDLGGIVLPAGTFVFAVTFTLRDVIHKRLGKAWAQACIWLAAILNIIMSIYLWAMARLPAPQYYGLAEPWSQIFAFVPAIVIGSIAAELISELVDTEAYHWWWKKTPHSPQWSRVLVSNAISLPLDSLVFASLAFLILPPLFGGTPLPISAILSLIGGQILWKAVVTLISLPMIYLVKEKPLRITLQTQSAESESWR